MQAPVKPPFGLHFFEWATPGCPVSVSLDLGVVENMQRECSSAETGTAHVKQGILLGDVLTGITRIAGFRPVACSPGDISDAAKAGESLTALYFVRPAT